MAEVLIKNVSKVFEGQIRAVDNVNIEIKNEEFVVLVGPSGCGKTTTLRMIAGLEEISEGEIYIDGKLVNDLPPKDRDIAMVFQNYALYPHMTVYENMAFGLKLRRLDKREIDDRVKNAAAILGLVEYLNRKPKALSGGQRQRVAVGRAIVRDPKVFLFDEPLSNLDAKLRVQMRTEISKLHKQLGATMIYVTHDQVEAMTMGDKIVIMKDGVVQQIDAPLHLYNNPVNKFVAGFIGSPSMNFIYGRISKDKFLRFSSREGKLNTLIKAEVSNKLEKFIDKDIIVGIRPEDIAIDSGNQGSANNAVIKVNLDLLEPLGNQTLAYFTFEGNQLVSENRGITKSSKGNLTDMKIDLDKIHFFDAVSEQRI